jgi:hypothetical protein
MKTDVSAQPSGALLEQKTSQTKEIRKPPNFWAILDNLKTDFTWNKTVLIFYQFTTLQTESLSASTGIPSKCTLARKTTSIWRNYRISQDLNE